VIFQFKGNFSRIINTMIASLPNEHTIHQSKKYIDTKQSNKRNIQNSKVKRQDYNMK